MQISAQNTRDSPEVRLLPLFNNILRVCLALYSKKLYRNPPEELIPWLTNTKYTQEVELREPLPNSSVAKAMWATEEKAINTFISVAWAHKALTNIKAQTPTALNMLDRKRFIPINLFILIKPNPPSLSKIAAKNIEPTTGASTWALGNHIWKKNMGSFTKKAKRAAILNGLLREGSKAPPLNNIECPFVIERIINRKRGRDLLIVYRIIAFAAPTRSIW